MSSIKKAFFYAVMGLLVLVTINLASMIALRVLTGINPLARGSFIQYKSRFIKSAEKLSYAHPYFGRAFSAHYPVSDIVSTQEPVLFAAPKHVPAQAIKVLILGGSVATNFSINKADDVVREGAVRFDQNNIFERALNAEFATNRFAVYNAALPGGKQPQQLFKLYYLYLLSQSFDIVINVDGFNEVALPFAENIPRGNHPIFPRNYSSLLLSTSVDTRCIALNNRLAESYSRIAILELGKLLYMMQCGRRVEAISKEDPLQLAEMAHFQTKSDPEFFTEVEAIWRRSTRAIAEFANQKSFDYIHVLQPSQYVDGSKAFSEEELSRYRSYAPYGQPISKYYERLDLATTGVRHTVDLRYLFKENRETLYRDHCCHFTNRGMLYLAEAIIKQQRGVFEHRLSPTAATQ